MVVAEAVGTCTTKAWLDRIGRGHGMMNWLIKRVRGVHVLYRSSGLLRDGRYLAKIRQTVDGTLHHDFHPSTFFCEVVLDQADVRTESGPVLGY